MSGDRRRYDAISGVRVVMSVWVLLLHVTMMITALTLDSDAALTFSTLPWANAAKHLGCQVDVFLAISGFLITMAVLDDPDVAQHPVRATIAWVVKRALRMWPAMLTSVFLGWVVGDYNVDIPRLIYKTVTFTSNVDPNLAPFTFIIAWSNSVDVKAGAVLLLIAAVAKRYGYLKQSLMHLLLGVSVLILVVAFMQDPENAGLLSMMQKNIYRITWTTEQQAWVHETFQTGVPVKPFLEVRAARIMYLGSWARCGPMFLGAALALRLKESDAKPQPRAWWRTILTALMLLLSFLPAKPVTTTPTEYVAPPVLADLLFTVSLRPWAAFAWCELLFAALVSPSHPAHVAWFAKALSWRPFQTLAEITHPFYLLHYRICLSVVMFILHPSRKHIWGSTLGEEYGLWHVLVCSIVAIPITGVLAYAVHHCCEIPIWRNRDMILGRLGLSDKRRNSGHNDEKSKAD